jgi:hypothetical protein
MFTFPVTCQSLFDDDGKPYWFYWPHKDFGFKGSYLIGILLNKLVDLTVDLLDGFYVGNFMSFFPIIVPRDSLSLVREVRIFRATQFQYDLIAGDNQEIR